MHTEQSVRDMGGEGVYALLKDVSQRDLLFGIAYLAGLDPAACADLLNDIEGANDAPAQDETPAAVTA